MKILPWKEYRSRNGEPWEFIMFSDFVYQSDLPGSDPGMSPQYNTATVTLTQRDSSGRLYRNDPKDPSICFIKFSVSRVTLREDVYVIEWIAHTLQTLGYLPSLPKEIRSYRQWRKIREILVSRPQPIGTQHETNQE